MRLKIIRRVLVATVCVFATMLAPAVANAAILTVNDDTTGPGPAGATCGAPGFATISAAVTAAAPGDTILVCAGTYNTVNVNKTLTILGAQAGVDARTRSVDTALESVVTGAGLNGGGINITANAVLLDGFTVENTDPTVLGGYGITTSAANSGQQILNNRVRLNVVGVYLNNAATSETLLRHNFFDSNNAAGSSSGDAIYSDNGTSNVRIDQNRFSGHSSAAMVLNAATGGTGITITGNQLVNDNTIVLFNTTTVVVQGNTSTNSPGSGVLVGGGVNGITVGGNRIVNAAGSAVAVADFGFGPNSGISISGNTLVNNLRAIRLAPASVSDTVEAHFNRIAGNTTGVVNAAGPGGALNAENNWWGCNAGPNQLGCDTTTGDVDSDPWLQLRASADQAKNACTNAKVTADLLRNSNGQTPTPNLFPNGTEIRFGTTSGSIETPKPTTGAVAETTLTAAAQPANAMVTATLDNQTEATSVTFDTALDSPVVSAKKVQRQRGSKIKVKTKVGAAEAISANVTGKIKVKKKSYKLKEVNATVGAGGLVTLTLKPVKKSARKKIAAALKKKKKVRALLQVNLTDSGCTRNTFSKNVRVKLKAKKKKKK